MLHDRVHPARGRMMPRPFQVSPHPCAGPDAAEPGLLRLLRELRETTLFAGRD